MVGRLQTFALCDQAVIVPCFTLSWQWVHTQRRKVGSLLSSCWHLWKTMPIQSLGIEAVCGPGQTLSFGFGRGTSLSTFPYSGKKQTHCFYRAARSVHHNSGWETDKHKIPPCIIFSASQEYTSKHVSFIVSVTLWFYIYERGQSAGSQCVSVCWQHEMWASRKKKGEVVWKAASRLETVGAGATTIGYGHEHEHSRMRCLRAGTVCSPTP